MKKYKNIIGINMETLNQDKHRGKMLDLKL